MSNLNLEELYGKLKDEISRVDFTKLWEGFRPLKFALYNDEECFFDGQYIEKTADFCANTAISYQGEMIGIWKVEQDMPVSVFASKMIHEMFHGFQREQGWECWPEEMEALYRYSYSEENLSVKLHENRLLLEMQEGFDPEKYRELLACRKYRSERYPYEFSYECGTEEIEGSANYVEWQVLRQLDEKEADKLMEEMRTTMLRPEFFFPIRISCYFTGALLIDAMIKAGSYDYGPKDRPVINRFLAGTAPANEAAALNAADRGEVSQALASFEAESKRIVEAAVEANEVVLEGPKDIGYVNIYNARCYKGYITSTYFVMYIENGENKVINGNFVVKMKDEKTIDKVYRWV